MDTNRNPSRPMPSAVDTHTDAELIPTVCRVASACEVVMRRANRLFLRTERGLPERCRGPGWRAGNVTACFREPRFVSGEAAAHTWLARVAINVALTVQRVAGSSFGA